MNSMLCGARMRRSWRSSCAVLLLLSGGGSAMAAALGFDDAVALATRDTPQILAAQLRLEAVRQAAIPAGELPDPRVAIGVENFPVSGPDRYSLVRDTMTMKRVALMQEVPNRAKRAARVAVAAAQVARSEVEQRVTAVTLQREAASAWIRRYTIEQKLSRLDALVEENHNFDLAVRAQLASGRAAASDVVLPPQEAAMLAERRDELLSQQVQAIAALRRWIGDAAAAPLRGAPPDWALASDTLARAMHSHPELQSLDAMGQVLDAEVQEAESGRQSDWSVELAFQRRGPTYGDMVSLQFSFDLPIFADTRQDPQIASKRAERARLDAERDALRAQHVEELASDWAEFERLGKALERSRGTLQTLARERIDLTLAAYASGKASLTHVVAARRDWIELQLKQAGQEGERALLAARLHYVNVSDDAAGGVR